VQVPGYRRKMLPENAVMYTRSGKPRAGCGQRQCVAVRVARMSRRPGRQKDCAAGSVERSSALLQRP